MVAENILQSVNEIMFLYERFGNEDYIGEPISQIEHMCQCAQLAAAAGVDDEVILAAFFHDIGHLYEFAFPEEAVGHMESVGGAEHENLGAIYLSGKGFSEKITKLVKSHVPAKRYLTYNFPEYYNQLSEASKKTLEFQGGKMTPEEAKAFEEDSLFDLYVLMRRWDDQAKQINQPLPNLFFYKQMIIEHLSNK